MSWQPFTALKMYLLLPMAVLVVLFTLTACSNDAAMTHNAFRNYPDAGSDAGRLYINKCGECHAAPLPTAHRASHWPGVVERMQFRRINKAMPELNAKERQTVLDYLQKHARQD